jgi:hypothetical protein
MNKNTNTYGGGGMYGSNILNLDISGQLDDPTALSLKKQPHYPLDRRLVGLHCQSGYYEDEERNKTVLM